jgi:hypothetical protein
MNRFLMADEATQIIRYHRPSSRRVNTGISRGDQAWTCGNPTAGVCDLAHTELVY